MSRPPAAPAHRPARRFALIVVGVTAALLALAPSVMAKPKPNYRVKMTFEQLTSWTMQTVWSNPTPQPGECTSRVDDGHGQDTVVVRGTARIVATKGSVASFDTEEGSHTRTGVMTHDGSGPAGCDDYDRVDSVTGCGTYPSKANFPTLEFTGRSLTNLSLDWGSDPTPDFVNCPYFSGVETPFSEDALPGQAYLDFTFIELPRGKLRAGKPKVRGEANISRAAVQSCGNITDGCVENLSYSATGSVDAGVEVVLKRIGRRR